MKMRLFVLLALGACSAPQVPIEKTVEVPIASAATLPRGQAPEVPAPMRCLTAHYDAAARFENGAWSLVVPREGDSESIPYAEVIDVYEPVYKAGPIQPVTDVDFDPGRVRIDSLFYATYGKTAKDVEAALTRVSIGHKTVLVHRKIAEPLRRVAERIDVAMQADPHLAAFFESLGGTFNWRKIAGTDELSLHAWAIAIDLDTTRSNYWRNETTSQHPLVWKNRYSQAIVDAFESEGFAWGGRWYHYDTMHFEYRPELLDPACYGKPK